MTEKKPQGFAVLTPEQRQALARLGGRTAQARGTGHHWTKDEARIAGSKGGAANRGRTRGKGKGGA